MTTTASVALVCSHHRIATLYTRRMQHQKWNAVGTAARVLKIARIRRNGEPYRFSLLMEGLCRFRISHLVQDRPYQVGIAKRHVCARDCLLPIPPTSHCPRRSPPSSNWT